MARRLTASVAGLGGCFVIAAFPALAADLPARTAAQSAPGLAVCDISGFVGFTLPGSDTCLRLGGYVATGVSMGSLTKQYGLQFNGTPATATPVTLAQITPVNQRDSFGFLGHVQVSFDARSNTDYGPARAYAELLFNQTSGFESSANGGVLNVGYLQWAGLTGGKAPSFFSYLAGGPAWYDFYSPDRFNGNQPVLLAYTATMGPVSATVSIEDPFGTQVNNTINGVASNAYFGNRFPDLVAAVRYEQTWGSAQLSGALHNTHVTGLSGDSTDRWGEALLGGVTLNLPGGGGDRVAVQGVYSHGALGYSGLNNTAWSPFDQGLNINGNGAIFQLTDALNYDTGQWAIPTTWSVSALARHYFTPEFSLAPEAAFASITYSGSPIMISKHATSWIVGATASYTPVPHLGVTLGAIYQATQQDAPVNYVGPEPFHARSSGVAATLQIVRDF